MSLGVMASVRVLSEINKAGHSLKQRGQIKSAIYHCSRNKVHHELNSTAICAEGTWIFKGKMRGKGGTQRALEQSQGIENYKRWENWRGLVSACETHLSLLIKPHHS